MKESTINNIPNCYMVFYTTVNGYNEISTHYISHESIKYVKGMIIEAHNPTKILNTFHDSKIDSIKKIFQFDYQSLIWIDLEYKIEIKDNKISITLIERK